jgi:hypothetical protein
MLGFRLTTLVRRLRREAAVNGAGLPMRRLLARSPGRARRRRSSCSSGAHGRWYSVCRRILHHTEDAEDAFQAVFHVLARKAGGVSSRHSPPGMAAPRCGPNRGPACPITAANGPPRSQPAMPPAPDPAPAKTDARLGAPGRAAVAAARGAGGGCGDKLVESLPRSGRTAAQQIDAVFLATLGRLPTATEVAAVGKSTRARPASRPCGGFWAS